MAPVVSVWLGAGLACSQSSNEETNTDLEPLVGACYGEDYNNLPTGFSPPDPSMTYLEVFPEQIITYFVEPVPDGLPYSSGLFQREVDAALVEWKRVLANGIGFVRVSDPSSAHWVFGFRSQGHGDECDAGFRSFSTLAHSFTYGNGCLAGEVHFNRSIPFVLNGSWVKGFYDLRTVCEHEVGHLLGLIHSSDPLDLMYSGYSGPMWTIASETGTKAREASEGGN
jgi:hypothetical protein